jgi:hypothetical protein
MDTGVGLFAARRVGTAEVRESVLEESPFGAHGLLVEQTSSPAEGIR